MPTLHKKTDETYPARYSLNPEQSKAIAATLKYQGGATPDQIRRLARDNQVTQKPILRLLDNLGLSVLPQPANTKPQRSSTDKTSKKPRIDYREAAEALFKKPEEPAPAPEPTPSPITSNIDADAGLDALVKMEADFKAERTHLLEMLASMERGFLAEKDAVAEERRLAEEAMRQTRELRAKTREDREKLEVLEGDYHSLERRYILLGEKAHDLYKKVKDGMARERRLLKSLLESEREIEVLYKKCGIVLPDV